MIIGLTGGIASGKSTVSEYLRTKGYPIVDADLIAKEVVLPLTPAYKQIVHVFGEKILLENGEINRPKLGEVIFKNAEKRELLNGIVHPAVRSEMINQRDELLNKGHSTVILDIPLLFESGLSFMAERTLLIYVAPEIQITRLINRNQLTRERALDRIQSQMPLEEKKNLADAVIENNGSLEELYEKVDLLLQKWHI